MSVPLTVQEGKIQGVCLREAAQRRPRPRASYLSQETLVRTLLSFSLLCCSAAFAQDISSGSSALATGQAAMTMAAGMFDQPYGPTAPAQPVGPSQPTPPTMPVSLLPPAQPSQPGGPSSPTDPQQPSRSALVASGALAGDVTTMAVNVVTIRVPGQLQNVSAALNNLFRNLGSGGQ